MGIVVQLSSLAEHNVRADDLLEEFKQHPAVEGLLAKGQLAEYSSHLIPVAGKAMMPKLYTDGFLVAGDAAAFCLATGLILEGANFALASGISAAETVIQAKQKKDFSQRSLSLYEEQLKHNFILKDLNTFKKAPRFLENPRLYKQYPEFICELAEKIFTSDGQPRRRAWTLLRQSMKGKLSFWQILRDLLRMKGAI